MKPLRQLGWVFSLAAVSTALAGLICSTGSCGRLDDQLLDVFFRLRGPQPPAGDVALVAIDEASQLRASRSPAQGSISWLEVFQVAAAIRQAGAKAVVLDFVPDASLGEEKDRAGLQLLERSGPHVVGSYFGTLSQGGAEAAIFHGPLPVFQPHLRTGLSTVRRDPDRVLRTIALWTDVGGKRYYPLAVEAVALFEGREPAEVVRGVPERFLAEPQAGLLRIDFLGPDGTFPALSFWDVLEDRFGTNASLFRDRLVVVGSKTMAAKNRLATPWSDPGGQLEDLSGVESHAHIIHTLLHGGIWHARWPERLGLMFLAALLVAGLSSRWRAAWARAALLAGALALVAAASLLAFLAASTWLPPLPLAAAAALASAGGLLPRGRRVALRPSAVSPPAPIPREVLALFVVDMCGSTELNNVQGNQFATRLKEELRTIVLAASEPLGLRFSKGTGDGLLQGFTAVSDAVLAAQRSLAELARRNAGRPELEQIHVRFAVHLGEVNRVEVRGQADIEGDPVNMVCRIEGLKAEGLIEDEGGLTRAEFPLRDRILLSEAAHDVLPRDAGSSSRYLGFFDLKGIKGRHRIYQVLPS
jgi:CHASE2 domain-containing sensor protein